MSTINWSHSTVVDTAQSLMINNIVLLEGQLGIESDTRLFKLGDGLTPWTTLGYMVTNDTQSVWMGSSTDAGNLLTHASTDGGLLLRTSVFASAADVISAMNSDGALDALDNSLPVKAAVYRMCVLLRSVIGALGPDYADLRNGTHNGFTVQQLVQQAIEAANNATGVISDTITAANKTWSSTKITSAVSAEVSAAIAALVGSSPEALNTIYEIAAVLSDNQNLISTIMTELGHAVKFSSDQTLTPGQQTQARLNIGAVGVAFLGTYEEIAGKTLLQHFTEALGELAPVGTGGTVADLAAKLTAVEMRTRFFGCAMAKTNYDANTGQYTTVVWTRSNGTKAGDSTLSVVGSNRTQFTKRVERYYAEDGITLDRTINYNLAYDANGTVVTETIASIT